MDSVDVESCDRFIVFTYNINSIDYILNCSFLCAFVRLERKKYITKICALCSHLMNKEPIPYSCVQSFKKKKPEGILIFFRKKKTSN